MSATPSLRLRRASDDRLVAETVVPARGFGERLRGLIGRETLPPGSAMLLLPCASVHTAFMRHAIDVVFLDRRLRVLGLAARVAPWRLRLAPRRTRAVLELSAGAIAETGLRRRDGLILETVPNATGERP